MRPLGSVLTTELERKTSAYQGLVIGMSKYSYIAIPRFTLLSNLKIQSKGS
jgi:hypothetical protein